MEIEKKSNYTYINLKKNTKNSFFLDFKEKYTIFGDEHLIINLLAINEFSDENILFLKEYARISRENGTSFVVISNVLDAGALEEELNVVPTFTEAEDFVEMESIERELGF